jgi:hypothetical protein
MARKRTRSTPPRPAHKGGPAPADHPDEGNVELAGAEAEETYRSLPGPLNEVFVLVRFTGRKRMYLHLGTSGEQFAYAHTLYSEGPSVLRIAPIGRRHALFGAFLRYLRALQENVDPAGLSPSIGAIEPDFYPNLLEDLLREKLLYDPTAL